MSAEHIAGTKATVMILDGVATLHLAATGEAARLIDLGSGWIAVTCVRFSPDASRLAIVARAALPQLWIVDVPGERVLATHSNVEAAVSPDGRAVMLEYLREQRTDAQLKFALVGLGTPGDPVVHDPAILKLLASRGSLSRQSAFQWTDPEVVAFVAVAGNEASVVAFQADTTGRIQKQGMKPLLAEDYVNASKLEPGALAAKVLSGAKITRVPSAGLTLRLQFPPHDALRLRASDVRVWE